MPSCWSVSFITYGTFAYMQGSLACAFDDIKVFQSLVCEGWFGRGHCPLVGKDAPPVGRALLFGEPFAKS